MCTDWKATSTAMSLSPLFTPMLLQSCTLIPSGWRAVSHKFVTLFTFPNPSVIKVVLKWTNPNTTTPLNNATHVLLHASTHNYTPRHYFRYTQIHTTTLLLLHKSTHYFRITFFKLFNLWKVVGTLCVNNKHVQNPGGWGGGIKSQQLRVRAPAPGALSRLELVQRRAGSEPSSTSVGGQTHTYSQAHTHTHTYANRHTHTHANRHTHTHTHTHTLTVPHG